MDESRHRPLDQPRPISAGRITRPGSGGSASTAAAVRSPCTLAVERTLAFHLLRPRFGHHSLDTGEHLVDQTPLEVQRLLHQLESEIEEASRLGYRDRNGCLQKLSEGMNGFRNGLFAGCFARSQRVINAFEGVRGVVAG